MNRIPDFFIVGAPKCGTTAMNDYLAQHPDVFVPARKEMHFFGCDLVFTIPRITRDEYLQAFANWRGQKRIAEASVWYLYSRTAVREIREFSPAARILVMLRQPVDMMYSLHSQRIYNGTEDLE
ncbi:MAG: sulfotransferase, partial [Candidatus Binatia bacterium]